MSYDIQFGLRKPENEPVSVDEMRRDIQRQARHSKIIYSILDAARHQGKSGEDMYAMLAYYALIDLERLYQQQLTSIMKTPSPSVFIKTGDAK